MRRATRRDDSAFHLRAPAAKIAPTSGFDECERKLSPVSHALKWNALLAQATLGGMPSRLRKTVAVPAFTMSCFGVKFREEITRAKTREACHAAVKKRGQLQELKAALKI
jgi:hypothetical protein